jgi:small subunit ribosomal protein S17
MAEEEKKDVVDETPQDEGAEAADPVAEDGESSSQAAGEDSGEPTPADPVEEDDSSPSQAAGEEPSSTPPAGEADAEEAGEASEEDQLPWKEKRRLERSRRPHKPGPALTPDERAEQRAARRQSKAGMRRKERAAKKQAKAAGTGTPPAERESVAAKVRQGVVVSSKGEKSITVRIDIARRHPTYEKVVRRSRTLHAHDERNEAGEGDVVRIVETRPLSKTKRWRLVEVLERAK